MRNNDARDFDTHEPALEPVCRLLGDTMTEGLPEGTWRCGNDGSGGSKHRYAEAVLIELGGIDIDGTLEFFREHGGYCDCEILLNVDPDPDGSAW